MSPWHPAGAAALGKRERPVQGISAHMSQGTVDGFICRNLMLKRLIFLLHPFRMDLLHFGEDKPN